MPKETKVWDGVVDPDTKALKLGFEQLSDSELLAIVIRTGSAGHNAAELASLVLSHNGRQLLNLYDMDVAQLMRLPGIGRTKALQLKAVAEAAKRLSRSKRQPKMHFDEAASVAAYYMEQLRHEQQEKLIASFFDAKGAFIGDACVSIGSLSRAIVSPRDIFRTAIRNNACFVSILHNHPSGDPTPSGEDDEATRRVAACGSLLDIPLLDHIIIGDNTFFSYYES
ncbi:MAG: DNA repair protein RadC, partial [Lachnospiraceae bacterium]|nr:DNA repair protein RadC [Lachnospiraceae bacterium]